MDFSIGNTSPYGAGYGWRTASVSKEDPQQTPDPGAGEKSLVDEIREKGFRTYAEEMEEKKKEELRQKILSEMGLNEESLAKMSPEQRAQIEDMINAEIVKRMAAEAELKRMEKGLPSLQADASGMARIDGAGVGLGPLLALQEAELQAEGKTPDKDEDAG
ncbi:hypothetical protein [Magnetovibrio sp.]|uniref:hypothetical protein n=1 Tax=Magnetovibrio sp. TaxID=2024836 RepID=UPI002F942905